MTSLADIKLQIEQQEQQRAQLQKQVEGLRAAERNTVIEEVREKIVEYGITATELKLIATKGRKVTHVAILPKYRNGNGETWAGGRGRRPKWVVDALAAGKSLSDFEV
ncbi:MULTISPECIES: H-NS family nucleoid-associated regulatory protein [unclassified Variovorax]|uniref:H-NS histone family protein n=1 Tax=unclassified Variovorax TaxID=663243 RepID=UPI0032E76088